MVENKIEIPVEFLAARELIKSDIAELIKSSREDLRAELIHLATSPELAISMAQNRARAELAYTKKRKEIAPSFLDQATAWSAEHPVVTTLAVVTTVTVTAAAVAYAAGYLKFEEADNGLLEESDGLRAVG